eukprot:s522_g8.t1
MGERRHGSLLRGEFSRAAGSSRVIGSTEEVLFEEGANINQAEETGNLSRHSHPGSSGKSSNVRADGADGTDATDTGSALGDVRADAKPADWGVSGNRGGPEEAQTQVSLGEQVQDQAEVGSSDKPQCRLSDSVQCVLRGHHIQHRQVSVVPDGHLQVEAHALALSDQGGCGGRGQETLEEKSKMDHEHARSSHGRDMGSCGFSKAVVLESQSVSSRDGSASGRRCGGGDHRESTKGRSPQKQQHNPEVMELSDPNAPTVQEQHRRAEDRADVVCAGDPSLQHPGHCLDPGAGGSAGEYPPSGDQDAFHSSEGSKKITLNRRQRRQI